MRPSSSTSTVGRQVSGNRKPVDDSMDVDGKDYIPWSWQVTSIPVQKSIELDPARHEDALRSLLDLFKKFGNAYYALVQFQCQDALQIYASLLRAQTRDSLGTGSDGSCSLRTSCLC
jgi:anaphase-promoting complex subunit 3